MITRLFLIITLCGLVSGCGGLSCHYGEDDITFEGARWLRTFKATEKKSKDGTTERSFESAPFQPLPSEIPILIDR